MAKKLMIYPDLVFPKKKDSPFFFTNFVSTLDGKVQILKKGSRYWPIGSETDFQTLLDLRAYSDLFIHGKNTALGFNHLSRINSAEFRDRRKKLGKDQPLEYMIITTNPDDGLIDLLKNDFRVKAYIVTTTSARISKHLESLVNLIRLGEDKVDLKLLARFLFEKGFLNVLMEGGPTLLGEFLKEDLIDEVFLTIAPKIFGNKNGQSLTLVEGNLFNAEQIKKLHLISVKQHEDELFLRYGLIK